MPDIAILKPDHLGDLVLASPAIRAICRWHEGVTLFVSSGSCALARFLFGETLEIRCVDFPHLSRVPGPPLDLSWLARELERFEFVFCLRDDPVMRALLERVGTPQSLVVGDHMMHDTMIHKRAISEVIGRYSRTELFSELPICWPATASNLGLCIAAGFPTNRWPNAHWRALASSLGRQGRALTLIGGPGEREDLCLLSHLLEEVPHTVARGSNDFGEFLNAISEVDLVVATDGGTAHICSLRKPICSVFGSSPWRRYAPFGRDNIVITRDEVCSPCAQYSSEWLNGCLTRECMAALSPRLVARVALSNGLDLRAAGGARVERSVSHRQFH